MYNEVLRAQVFTCDQIKDFCPSRLGKFRTVRCYGSRHLLLTSPAERISRRGAGQAGQTLHHILLRYARTTDIRTFLPRTVTYLGVYI